jgi:succinylarginine dihydrolase
MREVQFDGLVGPTHNYGGLSPGNVASTEHEGQVSNPRAAVKQGLAKMRFVRELGVAQAILPPQDRPSLTVLRRLGFHGSDEEVISQAAAGDGLLLRVSSSASSMWTANAATVTPSCDTGDAKVHFVPANLQQMFHRSIEAPTTTRILRAIFADTSAFVVHDPLPGGGQFADEGAANQTRLETSAGAVQIFAWGKHAWGEGAVPKRFPARQTREASHALARFHALDSKKCFFPQQHPDGIDAGAFHTDVMAVGNGSFFMLHELAFADQASLLRDLRKALGDELFVVLASEEELPAKTAVHAYPFNSQVLTLPARVKGAAGRMAIIAPLDSLENERARLFLEKVVASGGPVEAVHYLDVRQSMHNGGGPACLRLRVPLTDSEEQKVKANVFFTAELEARLSAWADARYRDRLVPGDLKDPSLARESMTALDELTRILGIGNVYDFQMG